jgi:hypothetical protein
MNRVLRPARLTERPAGPAARQRRRSSAELRFLRSRARWQALLGTGAALLALGLLVLLGTVAHRAVVQGEALQQARDIRAEVAWRCRGLQNDTLRLRCRTLALERSPTSSADVQALAAEAALRP